MYELALFAGAGGGILGGVLLGWQAICAVEKDPFCRDVLLRRQRDGLLPLFPIWDDIQTFDGTPWRGIVDIVTAGFPCQPWSVSGKMLGEEDERDLWDDTLRCVREVGPQFAFLENVPGLLRHNRFGEILGDLAEIGYDARWEVISAAHVGAPHLRERLWILAYPQGRVRRNTQRANGKGYRIRDTLQRGWNIPRDFFGPNHMGYSVPETAKGKNESEIHLVADGVAYWVDKIRAIGNGQVPQVVAMAFKILSEGLI